MFCPKCGNKLEQNMKFCNKCGAELLNTNNDNKVDLFSPIIVDNNVKEEPIVNETNINNFYNAVPNSNEPNNITPVDNTPSNINDNQQVNTILNNTPVYNNNVNYNQPNNYNEQNINNNNSPIPNNNYQQPYMPRNNNTKLIALLGSGLAVIIILITIIIVVKNSNKEFYFDETDDYSGNIVEPKNEVKRASKYSTIIIADNQYTGVTINDANDAYKLISSDSVKQKSNCPSEIKKIEEEIINKYGITAVNLCELDIDFAREIDKVFGKVYNEYPSVRGYLTNLTLINAPMSKGYIAAFQPTFPFAESDNSSVTVIKTQVLLNTAYFLNEDRLKSSVTSASKSGHFPKNATAYSPVAHELGHYLSFLAMMKSHNVDSVLLVNSGNESKFYEVYNDFSSGSFSLQMIKEAYENYKRDKSTTLSLDEWRGTISQYALAKDNEGKYIYDETIAESFHDVYLNGNNAADASKYVIAVLKSKL